MDKSDSSVTRINIQDGKKLAQKVSPVSLMVKNRFYTERIFELRQSDALGVSSATIYIVVQLPDDPLPHERGVVDRGGVGGGRGLSGRRTGP